MFSLPFSGKFGSKSQIVSLSFNGDIHSFCFLPEIAFLGKPGQKIKTVNLSNDLMRRLIRIYRIQKLR